MRRLGVLLVAALAAISFGCSDGSSARAQDTNQEGREPEHPERWTDAPSTERVELSEAEWRRRLSAAEYHVLREEGTERAFSGRHHDEHGEGIYRCAGCGAPLFSSAHKFDSGTGWPSYWAPIASARVRTVTDRSLGVARSEVECARCGSHLGHVFEDGPPPTGLRYCINSVALDFDASARPATVR